MTVPHSRAIVRAATALLSLAGGLFACTAAAQVQDPAARRILTPPDNDDDRPVDRTLRAVSDEERESIRVAAAERLARSGVMFIRRIPNPTPDQYRIAALLVEAALRADPGNAEFLRRQLDAWQAAGDEDAVYDTTAQLVRLDPSDTVAQLRFISANLRKHQDADKRMAAYRRLLGPGGAALDASIRSRLALDAALLARETGDEQLFINLLVMAVQLDATNKDAAVTAATFFMERQSDPMGRVELLANVVLADPLDVSAHAALAKELASFGAWNGARRFYDRTMDISAVTGTRPDDGLLSEMQLVVWALDGPETVLEQIAGLEAEMRFNIEQQRRAAAAAGEDPEQAPAFIPIQVYERVRLIVASAIERREEAADAVRRLEALAQFQLEQIDAGAVGEVDEATRSAVVRQLRNELLWQRVWSGQQLDKAESALADVENEAQQAAAAGLAPEEIAGAVGLAPDAIARRKGWLLARKGELQAAGSILAPLAPHDPLAGLGMAFVLEQAGRREEARTAYAAVALDQLGTLPGMWATERLKRLLPQGEAISRSAQAVRLDEYALALPKSIDAMTSGVNPIVDLSIRHVQSSLDPLSPMLLRVMLRNTTGIPLAVGEYSPINSRLLLAPRISVGLQQITEQTRPEVVSMARRLRLGPGESIETVVWAGRGESGWLLDQTAPMASSIRWRAIQGFQMSEGGQFFPGPYCVTSDSDLVNHRPMDALDQTVAELVQDIRSDTGLELMQTILRARWRIEALRQIGQGGANDEQQRQIADAVAARLEGMDEYERIFTYCTMPAGYRVAACEPIDNAALEDPSDLAIFANLLYRVARLQDRMMPLFERALASDDPVLREYAALLHDLLEQAAAGTAAGGDLSEESGTPEPVPSP